MVGREGGVAQLTRILPITAAVPLVPSPGTVDGWNQGRDNKLRLAQANSLIQELENLNKDPSSISCLSPGSII